MGEKAKKKGNPTDPAKPEPTREEIPPETETDVGLDDTLPPGHHHA